MTPEELRHAWPEVESKLKVGDIILVHVRSESWIPTVIQNLSDSHWSHAALAFATGEMLPLGGTIIVESFHPEGIIVHNIGKYTSRPEKYDIGVMRDPRLSDSRRESFVRSFMLSQIDVPYATSRVLNLGLMLFLAKYFGYKKNRVAEIDPNRFHCSTFVHRAVHGGDEDAHPDKHAFSPADLVRGGEFKWVFNRNA
jgi:hypothetical protein